MTELTFGLTAPAPCSYLPAQQEQVIFLLPSYPIDASLYQQLLQHNFRRSGNDVYRPHCAACQECQSVRLDVRAFRANRRQQRILRKAKRDQLQLRFGKPAAKSYYPLYKHYIEARHPDGAMYPPSQQQLDSLLECHWANVEVLEVYHQQTLIAVSVVDVLDKVLSAVYTFYHPAYQRYSPGILAILLLIEQAQLQQKDYLHLGYYVADCAKMAYKAEFLPQQRFSSEKWRSIG
ncbi:arginyltransferase [Alkalimonas amylolytica]|nr:arginyltransferase [Alkalimonas amylolytica]